MANPPAQRRKKSLLFKLLVFLGLAGSIGAIVYLNLKQKILEDTYATLPLKRGTVIDKLAETGTIELVRTVEVKSTVAGKIIRLPIEAGDWIRKGQLMALIEPDPNQSLQLYQKRSSVERSKIDLQEQERNFNRQKTLFDRKMLPARDFENAQMRLARARSNFRLARLEMDILETKANLGEKREGQPLNLDESHIQAPIDGIVIHRNVEIGEVVASGLSSYSGGTVLFEIGDPSQMIVRGDIAEIDIGKLRSELEVGIVVDAYPDTTYHGRVRWIAPVGQKKQGSTIVTFDIEIEILDHEPRLRQGMSCDLDIVFSNRDSTLYLPVESVIEVFDDQDSEEEVKGRRGRFITYVVRDSTLTAQTDSNQIGDAVQKAPASADSTALTHTDSSTVPTGFVLSRFTEVELKIGLETSTRLEILFGLEPTDRIAEDLQLVRRKQQSANEPTPETP
ncbi:MAG: HlyD family secretion protein [Planctomycetota bacterium]